MNVTEANAAQTLLRWVTELAVFEHATGDTQGRSTVTDPRLVDAARILAHRSNTALGAGMTGDEAETRMRALLAIPGVGDPDTAHDAAALDPDDVLDAADTVRGAA